MQQMRFGRLDMSDLVEKAKQEIMKGVQKAREEDMYDESLKQMQERITDNEGVSLEESMNLVWLHQFFAPADSGPVSIKRFKKFLEKVVKPQDPERYNKMLVFFQLNKDKPISEKKQSAILRSIDAFLNNFRTLENAYEYSIAFKEAAISMATKLDAPQDMSVIERVKWLRIWLFLIRNQDFFWFDFETKGDGKEVVYAPLKEIKENELFQIFPDSMIMFEQLYFKDLQDNEIKLDLIQAFLNLYPESVREEVLKFGEIGYNIPHFQKLQSIRFNIKRQLFEHSWRVQSKCLFTTSGIKRFEPEIFNELDKACKNGGIGGMKKSPKVIANPYNDFKNVRVTLYEYMTMEQGEIQQLTCQRELDMHIEVYRWLQRHPDFRFGKENKTLKEYEIEDLFNESEVGPRVSRETQEMPEILEFPEVEVITVTVEEAFTKWMYDSKLVKSDAEIDWYAIHKRLDLENRIKELEEYLNGNLSKEEFLKSLGFSNIKQAEICVRLNKKGRMSEILLRPINSFL